MALVAILYGPDREVWFTREARLGRRVPKEDNNFTLRAWIKEEDGEEEKELGIYDYRISKKHARLYIRGKELWLQDLGSTNYTYLNNEKIPWAREGAPGEPVPVPPGKSLLRLGPLSSLEIEALNSPLGLSLTGFKIDEQYLMSKLRILMAELKLYHPDQELLHLVLILVNKILVKVDDIGKIVSDQELANIIKGEMDLTRDDYRLAMDKLGRGYDTFADTVVKLVKELQKNRA